jgi:peptide/nickel transport system substrate-binding protein
LANLLRLQVFVALVGLFAVAVALTYFLLVVTPTSEPAYGGTYVEGVVVDQNAQIAINPLLAQSNSFNQDLSRLVFAGLTRTVPGSAPDQPGQFVEPDLAERWQVSADGKEWEFYLRRNLRWQDGTPLTARDVLFTFALLKAPDFAGNRDLARVWNTVEVSRLGDYGVRFRLQQYIPSFLSFTTLGLLPAHKLEGKIKAADLQNAEFNRAPVGNGPYILAPGGISPDGVTLLVNPLYERKDRKKPYLDKIWFRFYPSSSAALSALQADQIDGVAELGPEELRKLADEQNITEITAPRGRNTFLYLNLQKQSLFGEKNVRKALSHAINKQGLIENALSGQGLVSSSPILSSSWAHRPDLPKYDYDVARAERILEEAGWKNNRDGIKEKNNQALVFKILVSDLPEQRAVASYLAENLRAIEVVAQIEVAPNLDELNKAILNNNYDALLLSFEGALNDPDPYQNWHSSYAQPGANHFNYANWQSDVADQLLERARVVSALADRKKLYDEWQTIWAEELPSIPLYVSTYHFAVSKRLGGVNPGNFKIINLASDRFMDIPQRYIFTSTRFGT